MAPFYPASSVCHGFVLLFRPKTMPVQLTRLFKVVQSLYHSDYFATLHGVLLQTVGLEPTSSVELTPVACIGVPI